MEDNDKPLMESNNDKLQVHRSVLSVTETGTVEGQTCAQVLVVTRSSLNSSTKNSGRLATS